MHTCWQRGTIKIVKKLKLLAVELKLANRRLGKKQMEICLLSMVTFFP